MSAPRADAGHAKYHQDKLGARRGKKNALFDPEFNVKVGTQVLHEGLSRYGSLPRALQYYNGSLGDRSLRYTRKVMALKKSSLPPPAVRTQAPTADRRPPRFRGAAPSQALSLSISSESTSQRSSCASRLAIERLQFDAQRPDLLGRQRRRQPGLERVLSRLQLEDRLLELAQIALQRLELSVIFLLAGAGVGAGTSSGALSDSLRLSRARLASSSR